MTKEDILRLVNIPEKELESQAREYARFCLEGPPDGPIDQRIEDHEDAAQSIMQDYMEGYRACLSRIAQELNLPMSDTVPPPGS